jgi:hypothetical protein
MSVSLVRVLFGWIVLLVDFKGFFLPPWTRSKVSARVLFTAENFGRSRRRLWEIDADVAEQL